MIIVCLILLAIVGFMIADCIIDSDSDKFKKEIEMIEEKYNEEIIKAEQEEFKRAFELVKNNPDYKGFSVNRSVWGHPAGIEFVYTDRKKCKDFCQTGWTYADSFEYPEKLKKIFIVRQNSEVLDIHDAFFDGEGFLLYQTFELSECVYGIERKNKNYLLDVVAWKPYEDIDFDKKLIKSEEAKNWFNEGRKADYET